ncbi:MAG: AAA family ATPase [Bdellovibrionia bacterium]
MPHSAPRSLELVIFIGIQASGKSTFYRRYFEKSHQIVSKDLMRNKPRKSARQERLLHAALSLGHSVVLDNTNPTIEDRARAIEIGRQYGARVIAYYFTSDIRDNLRRNRFRYGKSCVPDVAIYTTAKKLIPPTQDEGFDEIWHVQIQPPCDFSCTKEFSHLGELG